MMKELDFAFEHINKENNKRLCGCYAVNPELCQQRHNQRILVPLKSSQYYVEIANSIANITLTQIYSNPTDKFLEVEYKFPINPDACVYRFIAEFTTTRIEGVVKEKEQAKQEYQQAIKEGKKAAYGELNADSKDILSLKVGNVPPKETVRIEIVYLQELTLSCNTFYQLHMVGTISPRYMNYIPTEHIKAGLRNEGAKVQGDFYWNFRISLRTSRKVIFFQSNTHKMSLISHNDTHTKSELEMTESCVPNRNFCFTYTTEEYQLPSYVFGKTDASSSAMLSFIPKFCTLNIDDAYKASMVDKNVETDISNSKGQYIFLLDRSGSMEGSRIQKAKQALILFIKSLPQDTYFNIISFGSDRENMFQESVKYSNKEINLAVCKVKEMEADLGGTEIYAPLYFAINKNPIDGYPRQMFLLTDGGVFNTKEVVNMVANHNKYSRVHTIGIGNGASEEIIVECAKKGKGQHVFISDNENPSQKIIQLLTQTLSPVISNMKLTYNKEIVESIIPNPEELPYVLKGQLVNFYITFKGQLTSSAQFSFSYEDSLNKLPFKSEIVIDPNSLNEPFIDRMGHFKRIRLLEESQLTNSKVQDKMFYVKVVDKKAEIIKQSVKHQILSVHTAFLCVQKQLIDGKYEQMKDKGQLKVQIQNPLPKQMQQKKQRALSQINMALPLLQQNIQSCLNRQQCLDDLVQKSQILKDNAKMFRVQAKKKSGCMGGSGPSNYSTKTEQKPSKKQESSFGETKKQSESNKSLSLIDQLISEQSADGSWSDIKLINKIFGHDTEKKIGKEDNLAAVITYLIAKWIEKHHPQMEYSLVVKKALNFVKSHTNDYAKIEKLFGQYIK